MSEQRDDVNEFDLAAQQVVDLGNRLMRADPDSDDWEIASGMLAGVIQFWLYSHQPCGDPHCDSCDEISTAERRLSVLLEEVRQSAEESDYFHSPYDNNVGRA